MNPAEQDFFFLDYLSKNKYTNPVPYNTLLRVLPKLLQIEPSIPDVRHSFFDLCLT